MQNTLLFARICLRQTAHCSRRPVTRQSIRTFTWTRPKQQNAFYQNARQFFRSPPPPVKGGTACLAALSPAAFIELSEEERDDGKTGEEHMLEASRAELENYVPEYLRGSRKIRRSVWRFFDTYIVEPIATGFRFLYLVVIFVPVIATVPLMWLGAKNKDRDNERSGTLWWYGFLVRSMERAGAAFIKASERCCTDFAASDMCIIARSMGCLKDRYISHGDVLDYVCPSFECSRAFSQGHEKDSGKSFWHAIR